jgi:5-enolpyruvylshikimate-3-phosphate synthase
MKRVAEPLEKMGARIESHEGCAPLEVHGAHCRGASAVARPY